MWEISIPTDRVIKANRSDLVLVLDDRALLLDVSVPLDHRVNEKVQEKISIYLPLAAELRRIWNKKITIVPVIIGALGGVSGTSRSRVSSSGPVTIDILCSVGTVAFARFRCACLPLFALFHNLEPSKLEGCRLALRRCVEARCQDVECLSALSVLCLVIALSDCIKYHVTVMESYS